MLVLHLVEILIWAAVLLHLGLAPHIQNAIYFCANAYTTLGMGSLDLGEHWRTMLSKGPGSVPMLRSTRRSVRLASVNNNSTRPSSAMRRNTAAVTPARAICTQAGYIAMPAAVNTMGAVIGVCAARFDSSA